MRVLAVMWVLGVACASAGAEWEMQESHTTASLRGIHAVSGTVAWASGTEGTVLRTVDGGKHWTKCAVPEGAEKLDFRGVQGFDEKTAIVMSSGKGDLSRLYKTVDGCEVWKLVFVNPDKDGFWDAFHVKERRRGDSNVDAAEGPHTELILRVIGDPVAEKFKLFEFDVQDRKTPHHSLPFGTPTVNLVKVKALEHEALFAASNSSFADASGDGCSTTYFATGGEGGARVIRRDWNLSAFAARWDFTATLHTKVVVVPVGRKTASSGVFSIAFRLLEKLHYPPCPKIGVAVGGDYQRAEEAIATAAYTVDAGDHWVAAQTFPRGYRSAVSYDANAKEWITVGPNGTDVSTDDGKNWKAVGGENAAGWNALSLPFVVGPKGRIGIWKPTAK